MATSLCTEEPDAGSSLGEFLEDCVVSEIFNGTGRHCWPVRNGVEAVDNLDVVTAGERLAAIAGHGSHIIAVGCVGVVTKPSRDAASLASGSDVSSIVTVVEHEVALARGIAAYDAALPSCSSVISPLPATWPTNAAT